MTYSVSSEDTQYVLHDPSGKIFDWDLTEWLDLARSREPTFGRPRQMQSMHQHDGLTASIEWRSTGKVPQPRAEIVHLQLQE